MINLTIILCNSLLNNLNILFITIIDWYFQIKILPLCLLISQLLIVWVDTKLATVFITYKKDNDKKILYQDIHRLLGF